MQYMIYFNILKSLSTSVTDRHTDRQNYDGNNAHLMKSVKL